MNLSILMDQRPAITDEIPAGQMALWFENDIVKIRYGTTTRTLDIGITLEEVEDLLQGSFQDTSSIKWTYDDNANAFFANLDSTLLASINSALQPNANITELTNNANYETPVQLSSRDSANRQRSNHSGSQLASTISNFGATVLSTIMTGISFATSSAVTASDSILIAIGKLQAQVTILMGRVFGTEAEDFEDLVQVDFSGNISLLKSFTTQNKPAGRYRVSINVQYEPAANATNDFFEARVDGTQVGLRIETEPKDSGADIRNVIVLTGYYQHASSGTFDIEVWGGNQNGTTELNGVVAETWRQS
jgi:hypothetical protein